MTWLFFAQQMEREDKQHEELSRLSSQLYTYMEKVSSFSFSFNTFLSILPPNEPSLAASLRNFLFDRGNKGTQFQRGTRRFGTFLYTGSVLVQDLIGGSFWYMTKGLFWYRM